MRYPNVLKPTRDKEARTLYGVGAERLGNLAWDHCHFGLDFWHPHLPVIAEVSPQETDPYSFGGIWLRKAYGLIGVSIFSTVPASPAKRFWSERLPEVETYPTEAEAAYYGATVKFCRRSVAIRGGAEIIPA